MLSADFARRRRSVFPADFFGACSRGVERLTLWLVWRGDTPGSGDQAAAWELLFARIFAKLRVFVSFTAGKFAFGVKIFNTLLLGWRFGDERTTGR